MCQILSPYLHCVVYGKNGKKDTIDTVSRKWEGSLLALVAHDDVDTAGIHRGLVVGAV